MNETFERWIFRSLASISSKTLKNEAPKQLELVQTQTNFAKHRPHPKLHRRCAHMCRNSFGQTRIVLFNFGCFGQSLIVVGLGCLI